MEYTMKRCLAVLLTVCMLLAGGSALALADGGSVPIELAITNNAPMFQAVSAFWEEAEGSAFLVMALQGSGYRWLFKGTYEQAAANGDGTTDSGNGAWIQGYENDAGKLEFRIPVEAGETFIPLVAISYIYYNKYRSGQNVLERAFFPRFAWINSDAATLVTGDYESADQYKAVVTKAPEPSENLAPFTGSAQSLVTEGEASGGEIQYALGENADTAPTTGWETSVPTGTEAGTYYVCYKVAGDANHIDSEEACVMVSIVAAPFGTPDFTLPADVRTIEANAFEGVAMTIAEIPDGCTSIGAKAFKNCANLRQIRIPASVTSIDTTAFEGCAEVVVYGTTDSAAQSFCADHANCVYVAENAAG